VIERLQTLFFSISYKGNQRALKRLRNKSISFNKEKIRHLLSVKDLRFHFGPSFMAHLSIFYYNVIEVQKTNGRDYRLQKLKETAYDHHPGIKAHGWIPHVLCFVAFAHAHG
jgi:hypothetical protein